MRHGTSGRRQRNRGSGGNGGRRGNGNNRMQVYDSNGPDVRIRGTAHQVSEKYDALAKDAASVGDIVLHQSYLQHAEHYLRIISAMSENARTSQSQDKSQHQNKAEQNKPRQTQEKTAASEDDLSLPASILGDSAEASSGEGDKERTTELSEA